MTAPAPSPSRSTPTQPPGRTAAAVLDEARQRVEPALRAVVGTLPPEIRRIAGYHAGWWDADGRPTGGQGKAVRPALALACARAVRGGPAAPHPRTGDAAVAAAVAVELVHDFSLLHDDVMDQDPVRRHRPAVWTVFGTGLALLAGDTLLAAAVDLLGPTPAGKELTGAVLDLCVGQAADLQFEGRTDVGLDECLRMCEGKTGAVLGAACATGALARGADDRTVDHYRAFGREVGLAFQLTDDLLGIWGDPAVVGKPVGGDLESRKKSLPVVAALRSGTAAGAELAALYRQAGKPDAAAVARAAHLVEAAGGRAWARAEADRRSAAALAHLAAADPDPAAAADLRALVDHLLVRER
ncbi:polyprenyl synthetase family protein [Kitasatospora sp. NPDC088391]|uniref:polyprenyl synthetase family protein n=1 Tax=Kitasatospora sp. NPDC088391 TaxID=3364074 RepID=UPI00380FD797